MEPLFWIILSVLLYSAGLPAVPILNQRYRWLTISRYHGETDKAVGAVLLALMTLAWPLTLVCVGVSRVALYAGRHLIRFVPLDDDHPSF